MDIEQIGKEDKQLFIILWKTIKNNQDKQERMVRRLTDMYKELNIHRESNNHILHVLRNILHTIIKEKEWPIKMTKDMTVSWLYWMYDIQDNETWDAYISYLRNNKIDNESLSYLLDYTTQYIKTRPMVFLSSKIHKYISSLLSSIPPKIKSSSPIVARSIRDIIEQVVILIVSPSPDFATKNIQKTLSHSLIPMTVSNSDTKIMRDILNSFDYDAFNEKNFVLFVDTAKQWVKELQDFHKVYTKHKSVEMSIDNDRLILDTIKHTIDDILKTKAKPKTTSFVSIQKTKEELKNIKLNFIHEISTRSEEIKKIKDSLETEIKRSDGEIDKSITGRISDTKESIQKLKENKTEIEQMNTESMAHAKIMSELKNKLDKDKKDFLDTAFTTSDEKKQFDEYLEEELTKCASDDEQRKSEEQKSLTLRDREIEDKLAKGRSEYEKYKQSILKGSETKELLERSFEGYTHLNKNNPEKIKTIEAYKKTIGTQLDDIIYGGLLGSNKLEKSNDWLKKDTNVKIAANPFKQLIPEFKEEYFKNLFSYFFSDREKEEKFIRDYDDMKSGKYGQQRGSEIKQTLDTRYKEKCKKGMKADIETKTNQAFDSFKAKIKEKTDEKFNSEFGEISNSEETKNKIEAENKKFISNNPHKIAEINSKIKNLESQLEALPEKIKAQEKQQATDLLKQKTINELKTKIQEWVGLPYEKAEKSYIEDYNLAKQVSEKLKGGFINKWVSKDTLKPIYIDLYRRTESPIIQNTAASIGITVH